MGGGGEAKGGLTLPPLAEGMGPGPLSFLNVERSYESSVPVSRHAVANAVVGVDGLKMTSAKHRESLPRGRRSKTRLEFVGGWAVVTEIHSLTATKTVK